MDMARAKRMITMTLDPELVERLDNWRENQAFKPDRNKVVEEAIKRFLDKNGG